MKEVLKVCDIMLNILTFDHYFDLKIELFKMYYLGIGLVIEYFMEWDIVCKNTYINIFNIKGLESKITNKPYFLDFLCVKIEVSTVVKMKTGSGYPLE